jgi:hypothetical protein
MKALKYLKKMYDRVPSGGIIDNALPEAIKELEALDKGNCENCKHLEIFNSLISYLDEAMEKAKTWDARCALQDVKDYLERKDD